MVIYEKCFLMFDTKGELDGDFHPQVITHQDVLDYSEKNNWRSRFKRVIIKARYKDYGYYDNVFDWPETWVYLEK